MSDFKAKMHQIVCRLGLRPKPRWGSLQRSRGEGRRGRGGQEREGERKGGGEGQRREGMGRGGAGSAPKLKLAPQNYFPVAGAAVTSSTLNN